MEVKSGTEIHGMDGDENPAGRELELVAAAKAGSNAAFEELQNRYSRRLYRRIRSMTRNHEDAEDALQETFLRVYLGLEFFEGRSQFATWITKIAINSALMVLRRRRNRPEVSFASALERDEAVATIDVRDTALNPEQLFDLCQRSDYALRAVSRLNIKLRTPMTAWIKLNCSIKEVARDLGLPLATVKSRLHRARKRLTRSMVFNERIPNVGSISGSEREYVTAGSSNRELSCPSFE